MLLRLPVKFDVRAGTRHEGHLAYDAEKDLLVMVSHDVVFTPEDCGELEIDSSKLDTTGLAILVVARDRGFRVREARRT